MKSFQSLASTLMQGVHSTYSEYSRGYQQHSTDNSTAILEEDERERRLTDGAKEEQAKEVLAAKTSVLFHEAAIPHDSMAAVVEKARERRAVEGETLEHNKASHTLSEDERERRISDNLEAQSREAIAAQVSVIVQDAMNSGVRPLRSVSDSANVEVGSLVEEERARGVADVEESQHHEVIAAETSALIQNQNLEVKSDDIDHSLTREISNMIISEAQKQHVLDTNALMTPSLVHPQQPANLIHPGIETPLILRDDTPMEVRVEEPVVDEVASRDSCPLMFHDEAHTSAPSAVLEGLIAQPVAAPVAENDVQYRSETYTQPEVQYLPEPQLQTEIQQQFEVPAQFQLATQYEAETDFRTLAVPAHTETHAVASSVKLYPMIFQSVEAPAVYAAVVQAPVEVVQAPWTPETAHVDAVPQENLLVRQQSCPVLATPAPVAGAHASSLASLQADAMDLTNSAPFTEWVESNGQPSMVSQAPVVPVLVRSLSAKELKQINRNINSHHNDALKEVRKAEKCVMKSEKYAAKGNTTMADKYKREALDHRMRVDQHQHVVVEEKAKIDATNFAAATPAL